MGHETKRKPRDARSPSNNCSQALREGDVIDGSGCSRGLQRVIGAPLEEGLEAWRQATVQASSRQNSQVVGPSTDRTGRRLGARLTDLGVCIGWLDRSPGAGPDPATVRRGVSPGVCAAVTAPVGLECAEAGAASSRTRRASDCPLAPRGMAAAKKRASNVKLA